MKHILLFSGVATALLGSATPPPSFGGTVRPSRTECSPAFSDACVRNAARRMLLEDSVVVYDAAPDVDVELARANVLAPATTHVEAAQPPLREAPPLRTAKRETLSPDAYADERVTGAGRVKVVVSLPEQKAFVFRGDDLIATSRVSTGKRGHETPVGTFRILQKKVKHHSNLYANAPMPYMQRLTNSGIALHAGHLPGYRASHGCIRLPWSFAKKLYGMTSHGTTVVVTNERIA